MDGPLPAKTPFTECNITHTKKFMPVILEKEYAQGSKGFPLSTRLAAQVTLHNCCIL